jgi:membrane protein
VPHASLWTPTDTKEMRMSPTGLLLVLKETARKWHHDNCLRLGASLSYYTLFSLFPLLLVVLSILRLVLANSDVAQDAILDALARVPGASATTS